MVVSRPNVLMLGDIASCLMDGGALQDAATTFLDEVQHDKSPFLG